MKGSIYCRFCLPSQDFYDYYFFGAGYVLSLTNIIYYQSKLPNPEYVTSVFYLKVGCFHVDLPSLGPMLAVSFLSLAPFCSPNPCHCLYFCLHSL